MPTCSMQFLTSRWPMARVQLVALQAIAIRYKSWTRSFSFISAIFLDLVGDAFYFRSA